MWRHNDVIGCNEYPISTWSEITIPWVEIWKKMWVGVFFWTQCITISEPCLCSRQEWVLSVMTIRNIYTFAYYQTFCSLDRSSSVCKCLHSFASSAYIKILLTSPPTSGKSLMKIINNSGPIILPCACGIPLITLIHRKSSSPLPASTPRHFPRWQLC